LFYDIAMLAFGVQAPEETVRILAFTTTLPALSTPMYAIDHPLGEYPYSISDGIISGINRVLDGCGALPLMTGPHRFRPECGRD